MILDKIGECPSELFHMGKKIVIKIFVNQSGNSGIFEKKSWAHCNAMMSIK
jgi:hypothetical protein